MASTWGVDMRRRKSRGGGGEPPPRKGSAPPERDSDGAVTMGRAVEPAHRELELRGDPHEQEPAQGVIDLRIGVAVAGAGAAVRRPVQRGVLVEHIVDPGAE